MKTLIATTSFPRHRYSKSLFNWVFDIWLLDLLLRFYAVDIFTNHDLAVTMNST